MLHRCDKLTRKKKNKEKVILSQSPFPPQEELYSKGCYLYLSEERGQVAWPKSPKHTSSKTWEGVRVAEVIPLFFTNQRRQSHFFTGNASFRHPYSSWIEVPNAHHQHQASGLHAMLRQPFSSNIG